MSRYVDSIRKAPKTLTEQEQRALLQTTGDRRAGFRDHVLFAVALGTALREHEIAALNVGDVRDGNGKIRRRFPLRVYKGDSERAPVGVAPVRQPAVQEAILPDTLRLKLEKLLRWKRAEGQPVDDDAPLFVSRQGGRLCTRQMRRAFVEWQEEAGFERRFTFHSLRHTALTNLYRATKDIRLVQRVARHASIESTTIYAQASDEDILRAVRDLAC